MAALGLVSLATLWATRAQRFRALAASRVVQHGGGSLLQAGERLDQPGLAPALEILAAEGPRSVYGGTLAEALLELMDVQCGLVTGEDLSAYQAAWSTPVEVPYAGTRFLTRAGLSGIPETLPRLPSLKLLSPSDRAVAWAGVLDGAGADGHTTNLTVVDREGLESAACECYGVTREVYDRLLP